MIPSPGETAGAWWANTRQREAMRENDVREGRDADAGFDEMTYFLHDVPPDVVAEGEPHQRSQSATAFEQPWPLDAWPTSRRAC